MAVRTAQPGTPAQRPPTPQFVTRLRTLGSSIGRPVFSVALAIIAGGIVIMITSPGALTDRFASVVAAYTSLFNGSFGNLQSISFTLVGVTSLILTGISVAIAFRAGLFNIGAEGQLAMGAMVAAIIGFKASTWPGWVLIPVMIIASMLTGAIWGGIVGVLKAWRGAHEVVTTIMLNWTAFFFTDYLIDGPFKAPQQADQTSAIPAQAVLPKISVFYNQTLGTFLPKIPLPEQYFVDVGFFLAILGLIVYWFIISRTTFGYEIRVLGQNPKAARYAGIPIKRNITAVMALAGAFSGLAGALRLMGQFPYQLIGSTFKIDSTGFDAIGVALVGRTTAIGVFFGSLLFGGLRQGGTFMQLNANVPGDLVFIIQALVLFSIASEFLPAIRRALPKWLSGRDVTLRPSVSPPLVPPISGATMTPMPEDNNGNGDNSALGASTIEDTPEQTNKPLE